MILVLALFALAACESTMREETALFEDAEERYARGDYDGASVLYTRFLDEHPLSPLADIAEQRLRTVDRELDAVMGRRGVPAPVYVNPVGTGAPEDPGVERPYDEIEAPEMPTFGR